MSKLNLNHSLYYHNGLLSQEGPTNIEKGVTISLVHWYDFPISVSLFVASQFTTGKQLNTNKNNFTRQDISNNPPNNVYFLVSKLIVQISIRFVLFCSTIRYYILMSKLFKWLPNILYAHLIVKFQYLVYFN